MTHKLWTKHSHEIQPAWYLMLLARPAITALLLATSLVACVADKDTALAAAQRSGIDAAAAPPLLIERIDHRVVNLLSATHDSDQPGASIAAYGK